MAKKYIDADLLRKEIKRIMSRAMNEEGQDVCNYILSIIDSSQKYSLPEWEEHPEATNNIAMVWNAAATPWLDWRGHRISVRSLEKLPGFDSLQQEQSSEKTCKDCGFYENNCPYIRGKFIPYPSKVCEDYTYSVIKAQERPSEDLKGEIREWVNLMVGASFPEQDGDYISEEDYRSVIRQTALHFYELGKQSKEFVSDDLEEEIDSFWNKVSGFSPKFTTLEVKRNGLGVIARHFANWQKEQMPMPEDTVIFQKGIEEGKRLMMEDAVEGKVFMSFAPGHNQMVMADVDLPTNTKVKIVIVKEDKE